MKTLIVYDSAYGNTEQVAKAMAGAIGADARLLRAADFKPDDLKAIGLLIAGSPTNGGRPLPSVMDFLGKIPAGSLKDVKVAAFDTRISTRWVGVFGFAAGRIAKELQNKGGVPASPPEGFFVKGTKGPVTEGELERAAGWVRGIATGK